MRPLIFLTILIGVGFFSASYALFSLQCPSPKEIIYDSIIRHYTVTNKDQYPASTYKADGSGAPTAIASVGINLMTGAVSCIYDTTEDYDGLILTITPMPRFSIIKIGYRPDGHSLSPWTTSAGQAYCNGLGCDFVYGV